MPNKRKKMSQEKRKKGKEWKRKVKVKIVVSLLNPKIISNFLFSVYARTSQANILHLDQKAAKCTTGKRVCDKF